jgi:hypothetical protein
MEMVAELGLHWRLFKMRHADDARSLQPLLMAAHEDVRTALSEQNVDRLDQSSAFVRIRALVKPYREELTIRDDSTYALAQWVLAVSYCELIKEEHRKE